MRLFFRVEYDGAAYGGWQRQRNAPSIQERLEHAFTVALRAPCRVTGAGRTDAGVHASAQGAHVDVDLCQSPRRLERSVNAILPDDIAIFSMREVDPSFHARFSARSRRYRYSLSLRKRPLFRDRAWQVPAAVDTTLMRSAIGALMGTHDFTAFCASGSGASHARCTVLHASLDDDGDLLVFTIEANRFVYNMVRSLAGTLVDIGRGRLRTPLAEILSNRDRRRIGVTAPSCGLVLDNVLYEEFD